MARYASLYGLFLLQRFKVLLEYRLNFFIGASSTVFVQAAGIATLWVVMRQVPSLNGWSFDELLLVYGLLTASRSIEHMFADNLWTIGRQYIRSGGFDRFLVRPIDPLFHLLADRFNHDGIGNLVTGTLLVASAWASLGIPLLPLYVLYAVLAVLSGGAIFVALNLLTATTAFWIVESVPVTRAVHEMHEFAKYPLSMYHKGIQAALTWLIPYGFASFYPASYLLGRDVGWLAWAGPAVALVLLFVAYRFWLFGLRHYSGTGS
ncbi:ABC-2 family transporter protein [Calidithermus terrae]|uniref:ABC-2 family transporter protein n=1 Tax=Calidithermus terrae TaxID=1408545 RepID=A0A399EB29_9DEIN|nr:ABC-2 family transporter protein [Calidithermus terrae]RIH81897.1 ABC-2 family transporter protein [Calidithermus terrae]